MNINPNNILLIQLRRIGDVLMTTPAVRAVKRRFYNAKITFLTEKPADEIFYNNPYVDEILLYNRRWGIKEYLKFIYELRKRKFDLVIDFFGNPKSAQITFFSGAKYRLGFNFRFRHLAYTMKVTLPLDKNLYAALHKLYLLKPLGIKDNDYRIEFFPSSADYEYAEKIIRKLGIEEDDFVIGLCPVSPREYKRLPAQKFAYIADNLIERYKAKILFIWGPDEKGFIDEVKDKMRYKNNTLDNYEVPTLGQFRALFEKIDLYVGNDNGLRHIAISARLPTVTAFGKPNPYNWTPPDDKLHRFIEYDPGCKENCNLAKCNNYRCITEINQTEYLDKIKGLIEELDISKKL